VVVDADIAAGLPSTVWQSWRRQGLHVLAEPAFWERHLGRIDPAASQGEPVTPADRGPLLGAASRLLDIAAAAALLLLTGPLMLVTALAIKLESQGPVFYRQQRVGLHGQLFTLIKFRSMGSDAEANGPVWAASRDARVTRVGGFIRRVRIDELPQLLCILRGEMSLIGPRPERPHFVEQLAEVIPQYRQRACVKPGLTGWAQVNFPYGASVEDARAKLSYDLYYVKHRSLMLDLMILLATVRVVLFQEGAR
jgi:exopolysaccharide biosynthesis polyprenyl glycosylphosphotransferase